MNEQNKTIFQQTITLEIVKGPPEEIDKAIVQAISEEVLVTELTIAGLI